MWGEVCRAATISETFQNLPKAIRQDTAAWQQLFDASEPQSAEIPGEFSEICAFDKLLIIRMIRPDKLVPAVRIPWSLL
jgi:dynein heavy chain, axonemal